MTWEATRRKPPVVPCPTCRLDTARTPEGDCTVCQAREARERTARERRAKDQEERDRLGFAPLNRSMRHSRWSLEAAAESLVTAFRFADTEDRRDRLELAMRHVHAARKLTK